MKKILLFCFVLGLNVAYGQRLSNSTVRNFAKYLSSDYQAYNICLYADFWGNEPIENRRTIIKNLGVNSSYARPMIFALYDMSQNGDLRENLKRRLNNAEFKEINAIWNAETKKREMARLEAKRKEKEKRNKSIRDFLVMRDSTVLTMPHNDIYSMNEKLLSDCLRETAKRFTLDRINLTITDNCRIDFDGKTKHDIEISGIGSTDSALVSMLHSELEKVVLYPMYEKEPYTGNSYPMNSFAKFDLKYSRTITEELLRIYKRNGKIYLGNGDKRAFDENVDYLSNNLKKSGRYDILFSRTDIDDIMTTRNIVINDFKKPVDNWFIEYNFSKAAPLGITVGANKIAYSKYWGAYFRYKSDFPDGRKLDDTNFEYTTERPKKEGYVRKGYTVGTTFAVFNNVYLYAGLGYGSCAVRYTNEGAAYDNVYGNKSYYQANLMKGLEVEGGCIWRFWKWIGVSVGYSTIVPFVKPDSGKFFGDINCGISLFL